MCKLQDRAHNSNIVGYENESRVNELWDPVKRDFVVTHEVRFKKLPKRLELVYVRA